MADAIVGLLSKNLNSLLQREFGLLWGVQKEMEKLSNTLSMIWAVLEDAEVKQVESKPIRDWLSKLKDAAYDADDILDEWSTESQQIESSYSSSKSCTNQVLGSISSCLDFKRHIFRYKMAKKIKNIMEKFDEIVKEKNDFNLTERQVSRVSQVDQTRITSSILHEPKTYGREADKENIVNLLLNNMNCECDVWVCPIVGIGGLGKTTLAQIVYNDTEVGRHFEKRMWVCVSEDFNVERLTKAILESSSGQSCDLSDLDMMQRKLREIVEGKRFLLVLDDVWNDNQDEWNKLKSPLISGAKGGAIIVTTRLPRVAAITGTIEAYHLNSLSQDDCWSLFRYHAFGTGNEEKPNLAKIGREIVVKCCGVPLAAKSLGSMLRFKSNESEWKRVRDSKIWELENGEKNDKILPALRLSYNNLSTQLKQCFAYCSIFPKDYEMSKVELTHLWIANGFIQSDGRMELEDIGEGIFNELIGRSLFQDIPKDEEWNIHKCKMHDLLHDLACSVMENECLRIEVAEVKTIPKKIRHFSFGCNLQTVLPNWHQLLLSQALCLRTFLSLDKLPAHQLSVFSHLKYLRVLNLGYIKMDMLPPSIANLKQLRYLNLRWHKLPSLPDWVGCLRNLQMLVWSGNRLETLPPSIGKLEQLRFLDLFRNKLTFLPASIGKLEQLRFLNLSGNKLTFLPPSIGELEQLRSLNLSCNKLTFLPPSIGKLEQLRFLDLSFNSELTFLPESINDLRNLHALNLRNCFRLELLPKSMSNLKNLTQLNNGGCWELTEMPRGIGQLTSLQRLDSFVVSSKEGLGIKQLQGLNLLKGYLRIERLEEVSDAMEAKEANLINKENLSNLGLCWSAEEMGNNNNSLEVLEALQPHTNIKELSIKGYPGVKFPDWMKFEFPNHLTSLSVFNLYNLEEFPWNWSKENPSLNALQELEIGGCPMLKTLPAALVYLTSLRTLGISECDSLTSLPKLGMQGSISSLERLEIWNCQELEFPAECFEHLTALRSLIVVFCDKLTSLPEGLQHAVSLEELSLRGCKNLYVLPDWMQHLTALRSLSINSCDELTYLPEGLQHAVSLEELSVVCCKNLNILPNWMQHLTALRRLTVGYCDKWTSLPEGLQHLVSLEELILHNCKNLNILPDCMQHLTALRSLSINNCDKLTSLPEGLQRVAALENLSLYSCKNLCILPDWMQHLTALLKLDIRHCHPELRSRCEKDKGQDWHKISHIPYVTIDCEPQW